MALPSKGHDSDCQWFRDLVAFVRAALGGDAPAAVVAAVDELFPPAEEEEADEDGGAVAEAEVPEEGSLARACALSSSDSLSDHPQASCAPACLRRPCPPPPPSNGPPSALSTRHSQDSDRTPPRSAPLALRRRRLSA